MECRASRKTPRPVSTVAAGAETSLRRIQRPIGRLVIATAVIAIVGLRGLGLRKAPDLGIEAVGDAIIYTHVGRRVRQAGGGPRLVLPLTGRRRAVGTLARTLEPDTMIGSTYHWLPLVNGYTGYEPPHRMLLSQIISGLPDRDALATLVDMTHVRWLLLLPVADWRQPTMRRRLLDALAPSTDVAWTDGRWHLLRVRVRPRHPGWFAAIARGTRPDETVLGTPLRPLASGREHRGHHFTQSAGDRDGPRSRHAAARCSQRGACGLACRDCAPPPVRFEPSSMATLDVGIGRARCALARSCRGHQTASAEVPAAARRARWRSRLCHGDPRCAGEARYVPP